MTESTGVEAIFSTGYTISGTPQSFQFEVANNHVTSALGDAWWGSDADAPQRYDRHVAQQDSQRRAGEPSGGTPSQLYS
jgi:hypothetical protein